MNNKKRGKRERDAKKSKAMLGSPWGLKKERDRKLDEIQRLVLSTNERPLNKVLKRGRDKEKRCQKISGGRSGKKQSRCVIWSLYKRGN